ncbi:hypothetical protein [Sorangium sp. So ce1024]|uniref:hypothetical protein n=1 Tax=unclassified Sorangium TaxID=2621164 RepID=UPI003F0AF566
MRAVDSTEAKDDALTTPEGGGGAPAGSEKTVDSSWSEAMRLLEQAAAIAAARGCDPQSFTSAAFSAYVAKNPAFRQWIETVQLAHRLEHLRREGRIGLA